ncbi:MAG: hypothetical protein ACE5FF_06190 [Saprospiraceae bacterium]
MEETRSAKRRRIVIGTLVVIILFILPAGSWFYLQSGLNHRTKALAELGDFGKITTFNLPYQGGLLAVPDDLRGKVSVVNFLSGDSKADQLACERIGKVHKSFDETDGVVFLSFIPADSSANLLQLATTLGIEDYKQQFLIGVQKPEWQRLASEVFKMENPASDVALADTSLTVRNYYDIHNNTSMGRLVEHIALIVPKQNRR